MRAQPPKPNRAENEICLTYDGQQRSSRACPRSLYFEEEQEEDDVSSFDTGRLIAPARFSTSGTRREVPG